MKRLFLWGVPALLLVALVAWRLAVQKQTDAGAMSNGGPKAPVVRIAPVASREMVQSILSVGNIVSPFKIEISPKISGRIEYLVAREGDSVSPGQILLKISPSDLQDAVLQQEAALNEARSRLAQAQMTSGVTDVGVSGQLRQQRSAYNSAKANLDQLERNYEAQVAGAEALVTAARNSATSAEAAVAKEQSTLRNVESHFARTKSLYDKGFLAAQELDDARTAVDVQKSAVKVAQGQSQAAASQLNVQLQNLSIVKRKGKADIAAARAGLAQSKAALDLADANRSLSPAYRQNVAALKSQVDAMVAQVGQAKARLRDTVVASTIAGTVTARKADPGGLATPGSPVLVVQHIDWLYARAGVPIEAVGRVVKGAMAEVTIDALPNKVFRGPVVNLNNAADPQNRQFGIDVKLDNPKRLLRPGMYATVKIVTGTIKARVVVPNEAVATDSFGNSTVTVVDSRLIAHVRTVKVGAKDSRGTEIREGVEPNEKVVVLSFNQVKDGQKVVLGADGEKAADQGGSAKR